MIIKGMRYFPFFVNAIFVGIIIIPIVIEFLGIFRFPWSEENLGHLILFIIAYLILSVVTLLWPCFIFFEEIMITRENLARTLLEGVKITVVNLSPLIIPTILFFL